MTPLPSPYRPGREIARGGMGAVLDARDEKFGRSVAMKVMLRRNAGDEEKQRFLQEARVLGQLAHPNIVPVHDLGTDPHGRLFYTMKLVQGVTLNDVLRRLKDGDKEALARYPLTTLLTIFQKVCDAVAFAHSRGIIHRDLKPANIMVGEFGEVLVMDWGLAKILPGSSAAEEAIKSLPLRGELGETGPTGTLPISHGDVTLPPSADNDADQVTLASAAFAPADDAVTLPSGTASPADAVTLASATGAAPAIPKTFPIPQESLTAAPSGSYATLEGAVMGTPHYMSPEQAEGRIGELDGRSDIFSLGGMLYALLTLRPPVEGDSLKEILSKVQRGDITPPAAFNAGSSTRHVHRKPGGEMVAPKHLASLLHLPGGRVPAALSAVAMKALTVNREQRYPDVAALVADIAAFQGGFATDAENANALTLVRLFVYRHKALTAAASLMVLLSVGFVFKVMASERKAQRSAKAALAAGKVAEDKSEAARRALARSQVSLAEAAYRELDGRAMLAALDSVPADLREGDWRYLHARADNSQAKLVPPAGRMFIGVAAHPAQPGVFAVAGTDSTISFFDAATGRRVSSFPVSDRQSRDVLFRTIDFSPDGALLMVGGLGQGGIAIYDTRTGKALVEWDAPNTDFVRFSGDGTTTLAVNVKGELTIYDAASGFPLWSTKPVHRALFTPAGQVLIAIGKSLRLLDGASGALVKALPDGRSGVVNMVLTRDGATLYLASTDGSVRGLRLADGATVFEQQLAQNFSPWSFVALSGDGRRVAAISSQSGGLRSARVWDAQTGTVMQSLLGSAGQPEGFAVHPLSGEATATGPDTRTWRLTTRSPQWTLNGSMRASVFWGSDDVFIPGGRPVALEAGGKWSNLPASLPPETAGASLAAARGEFVALGKWLAGRTAVFVLRKSGTGLALTHSLQIDETSQLLIWLRLSPDGQRLAAINHHAVISTFDTTTGQRLPTCSPDGLRTSWDLGWLDRDHLVGIGTKGIRGQPDAEERVVLWDANSGSVLRSVRSATAMDRLAIAPGGRSFAEGGADKRVRIRDAATLEVTHEFRAHDGRITALAFHPVKPILATASADLTIRLWNLDDLSLIEELRPSQNEPQSLDFSPTGTRLASTDGLGSTFIWDLTAPAIAPVRNAWPEASAPVTLTPATLAHDHARAGRWTEARTALTEAVRLAPDDSRLSMNLAVVLVQLGDRAACRAHGHAMLDAFDKTTKPEEMERAAKSNLLLPLDDMDAADRDTALRLAHRAVTTGAGSSSLPYFQFVQALAQYRAGDNAPAAAALGELSKSGIVVVAAPSMCVLALAQHRLGQRAEAQATLARAEDFAAKNLPKPDAADLGSAWNDVLIAHLLLREAREVIGGK